MGTFVILASVFFSVFVSLLRAWAVVTLWAWYVTPVFGIAAPGYLQAVGLLLLVATILLDIPKTSTDKKDTAAQTTQLVVPVLAPVFAVCLGWIVKYFGGL